MIKIRPQEIAHRWSMIDEEGHVNGKVYEIILPALDFTPEHFPLKNLTIFKNDALHAVKFELNGITFFVLGDFYNYKGQKNNLTDIAQHLNNYEKHRFSRWNDNERFGCAYYIREINDERYEEDLKKRWSA